MSLKSKGSVGFLPRMLRTPPACPRGFVFLESTAVVMKIRFPTMIGEAQPPPGMDWLHAKFSSIDH